MKKTSKTILAIWILTLAIACNEKQEKDKKFTISGQVSGFPEGTKFYLRNLATDAVFDSTTIQNNNFRFEGRLSNPPEQVWLNAMVDKEFVYANLLIGNDNISVKGDISDFPWNVDIIGSKTQEEFNYSQSITKKYDIKRDSLVKVFMKLSPDEQKKWENRYGDKSEILIV